MLDRIDAVGGTLPAIEQGIIQREIQDSAYRAQLRIDAAKPLVVGVNRIPTAGATGIEVLRIDPELEQQQRDGWRGCAHAGRASGGRRLDAWSDSSPGGRNLVPDRGRPSRRWRPSARSPMR